MSNWFDELAKAVGKGMSRRDAFRFLGAGALAVFGVAASAGRASADFYTTACRLICNGVHRADAACVTNCVACATGGGLVCRPGSGTTLTCCPASRTTPACVYYPGGGTTCAKI
jgi:hypothetical protein